jgi:hypothetical protein
MATEPEVSFIFDSDALLQILLAGQQQLFKVLFTDFGVSSFIMSEVDIEVRSNKKLGAIVRIPLDSALKSGYLKILSSSDLERLSSGMSAPVSLADIRRLGKDYALYVGTGEAYTHAAGILLDTPTVSNDMNAILTLESNGKQLPPKVFRSYDMFAFLYYEGYLDIRKAEQILKLLKTQIEWIPKSLVHSSFEDGIRGINCRLSTSLAISAPSSGWSTTFYLKRMTDGASPESK